MIATAKAPDKLEEPGGYVAPTPRSAAMSSHTGRMQTPLADAPITFLILLDDLPGEEPVLISAASDLATAHALLLLEWQVRQRPGVEGVLILARQDQLAEVEFLDWQALRAAPLTPAPAS
ncbi:MAG: hypothetical protein QM692_23730 [Thermomicrobiales bacterium]